MAELTPQQRWDLVCVTARMRGSDEPLIVHPNKLPSEYGIQAWELELGLRKRDDVDFLKHLRGQ